ncbi:hypothetical protein SpCBS45565_g06057 [Spizellomyces sp. 'palustris']|nr:hypothetical protein SpCBS45565_g06057 [Spizellomyces sp. 'palustris']
MNHQIQTDGSESVIHSVRENGESYGSIEEDDVGLLGRPSVEEGGPNLPDTSTADTTALLHPERVSAEVSAAKPHLSAFKILCLNAFWFGYQLYWFLVFIAIVPSQIKAIAGDKHKGSALSIVSLFAGFLNLFLAVFFGALNDRHPWIIVGALGMCTSLFLLWPTNTLWFYVLAYASLTASTVIASVPFNGLIADVTPPEQKGRVSAIMGGMNLGGYLGGALVGIFAETLGLVPLYMIMTTILGTATFVTVRLGPREPEKHYVPQEIPPIDWRPFLAELVRPLWSHRDFRLVFMSRFVFQLGIATIQQFMQYWIDDCVETSLPPTRAVSLALIPLLAISPITALLIPSSSRKLTVYSAAVLMCTTALILITAHTFPLALLASSIFGVGYGPFISVEFAMLIDVLPNEQDAAKDMSLWHSALVLPQIVATPVAGWYTLYWEFL